MKGGREGENKGGEGGEWGRIGRGENGEEGGKDKWRGGKQAGRER